jgi:short-subunit dehydrogenase involved in D-alanine esterification of teichoic acids
MDISGNTVLITGGASGIGLAMARAFLDAGSVVIACGRREERLLDAQKSNPGLHVRTCDVSSEQQRSELVAWITSAFPALNVLVNNAGVQRDVDFTNGIAQLLAGENEIRVNLEAPIVLSGLFVPLAALPPGLRAVARALPLSHAASLLQGMWVGDAWSAHLGDVAALAAVFVVGVALSARVFRWE